MRIIATDPAVFHVGDVARVVEVHPNEVQVVLEAAAIVHITVPGVVSALLSSTETALFVVPATPV